MPLLGGAKLTLDRIHLLEGTSAQSATVYGCLVLFKGIAVIIGACPILLTHLLIPSSTESNATPILFTLSGPIISASLHHKTQGRVHSIAKYGGYGFTAITIFVGSMMAVTTVGSVATLMLRRRKLQG